MKTFNFKYYICGKPLHICGRLMSAALFLVAAFTQISPDAENLEHLIQMFYCIHHSSFFYQIDSSIKRQHVICFLLDSLSLNWRPQMFYLCNFHCYELSRDILPQFFFKNSVFFLISLRTLPNLQPGLPVFFTGLDKAVSYLSMTVLFLFQHAGGSYHPWGHCHRFDHCRPPERCHCQVSSILAG